MGDKHDPGNEPRFDEIDPEVTSVLPAGGEPGSNDADSWVAQWRGLFDNGGSVPTARPNSGKRSKPAPAPPSAPTTPTVSTAPMAPSGSTESDPPATADKTPPPPAGSKERSTLAAKVRITQRRPRPDAQPRSASGPPAEAAPGGGSGRGRRLAALVATAALGVVLAVGYVVVTSGVVGGPAETAEGPDDDQNTPELPVGADLAPTGIQELARAAVQLIGIDDAGQAVCAGSGVVVSADGTILTNAHVVTRSSSCTFATIGVAVAANSTAPAELRYKADLLAVDEQLDLAVLRVSGVIDGVDEALPDSFPWAALGDSDTVALGDGVRILGFPVIGGDTITLTTGTVSGFSAEEGVGERAVIKTDATISAGNSVGMALDAGGRVIGIPSMARASEDGPAIDCRPVTDTNDDGVLSDGDDCVPVGGFLNGIRPINLAQPLLAEARSAQPISPPVAIQTPDVDPAAVVLSNPRFALGREGNIPVDQVRTASAGITELCFFVDWEGIPQGARWDGAWFIDNELAPALGKSDQVWLLEESGRNFWLCAGESDPGGLPAGVYEIGFFLNNELLFAEAITLTEEPAELVTVTWVNETGGDLCGLAINPLAQSGQVGLDEVGSDGPVEPGGTITMDLPLGLYTVEAYDCSGLVVADTPGGLPVERSGRFSITS